MDAEPLLHRDEVVAIFFAILDIDENVKKIATALNGDDDGEDDA